MRSEIDTSSIHHYDNAHVNLIRQIVHVQKYKLCARKILAIIVLFRFLFCCVAWRVFCKCSIPQNFRKTFSSFHVNDSQ